VVTVALDLGGEKAARRWIEAAQPEHPSLIDHAHVLDEHLGIVNVPSGVWIDEDGTIVRPAEPAFPHRPTFADVELPPETPAHLVETLAEARKIRIDPDRYVSALRDWVAHGPGSRFALTPGEVVARSRPRDADHARAAACFELAQHLHRAGEPEAAVPWFREAHRLQPDNWTYKRQAWTLVDRNQGRTGTFEGSWLDDVRAVGAENYYPPLDMPG